MYAIIETGGKQYRVQEGDVITVEKLSAAAGEAVEFDRVLALGDGSAVEVGTPYLEAARVFGSVVENGKGQKVIIFKYKSKKDYRKKQGHRQPYTMIQIEKLSADGKKAAAKKTTKKSEVNESVEAKEPVVNEAKAEVKEAVKVEAKKEAKVEAKKEVKKAVKTEVKEAAKEAAPKKTTAKKATVKKAEVKDAE